MSRPFPLGRLVISATEALHAEDQGCPVCLTLNVRRSKHGTDSMVISLGGIAPQGSLSLHTVGAHFWPKRRWII